MYLLVLAFTFVNCYCFMITSLYLLSFFTYFIQVPFINKINKIFKIPFSFQLSIDKIIYNKTEDEKSEDEKSEDEKTEDEKTEDEKTEDEKTEDEKSEDEKTEDEKSEDEKTEDEKSEYEKTEDEKSEYEKTNDQLKEIDDFIQIRKYKFLIDETLD